MARSIQGGVKASFQGAFSGDFLPAIRISAEIGPAAGAFTTGVYLEFASGCFDDPDKFDFGQLLSAGYTGAFRDMSLLGQLFTGAAESVSNSIYGFFFET